MQKQENKILLWILNKVIDDKENCPADFCEKGSTTKMIFERELMILDAPFL